MIIASRMVNGFWLTSKRQRNCWWWFTSAYGPISIERSQPIYTAAGKGRKEAKLFWARHEADELLQLPLKALEVAIGSCQSLFQLDLGLSRDFTNRAIVSRQKRSLSVPSLTSRMLKQDAGSVCQSRQS